VDGLEEIDTRPVFNSSEVSKGYMVDVSGRYDQRSCKFEGVDTIMGPSLRIHNLANKRTQCRLGGDTTQRRHLEYDKLHKLDFEKYSTADARRLTKVANDTLF